jgi:hypothetical protein
VLALVAFDSAGIDAPRYEPLPGLAELPAWLWRRAGRAVRIAAALMLLGAVAFAVALVPSLRESAREQDEATARARAAQRAELVRRLQAEQAPRRGRSGAIAPASADAADRLAARAGVMDDLAVAITADARARERRAIDRTDCEPYPRTVDGTGAHEILARRRGRYLCVAVAAEFEGGVIGEQYRALVDFQSGRYAFCKVISKMGPTREQLVTTPRACGG